MSAVTVTLPSAGDGGELNVEGKTSICSAEVSKFTVENQWRYRNRINSRLKICYGKRTVVTAVSFANHAVALLITVNFAAATKASLGSLVVPTSVPYYFDQCRCAKGHDYSVSRKNRLRLSGNRLVLVAD